MSFWGVCENSGWSMFGESSLGVKDGVGGFGGVSMLYVTLKRTNMRENGGGGDIYVGDLCHAIFILFGPPLDSTSMYIWWTYYGIFILPFPRCTVFILHGPSWVAHPCNGPCMQRNTVCPYRSCVNRVGEA